MLTYRLKPLTARDLDTLSALRSATDDARKHDTRLVRREGYVQPMDVGGRDSSHHSATLTKLTKRSLVEVWEPNPRKPWLCRLSGGKLYRITTLGREVLIANGYSGYGER